jgi:tRNA dimethylallyltransferase
VAGALLFLVGLTASGKKRAALAVADALPVELLSLDSMKVYRGMDLGTDKLAASRFALTNLVEPSERFSVGAYVRAAQEAVAAIRARGRVPLFVGGTGLYLRALVRGLFEVPDIEPATRARVAASLDERGSEALHAELARVDPATAARLHVHDRKRIARAFEVWLQTGRPLSRWQAESTRRPIEGTPTLVGLRFPRATLRERIAARVERMFAVGLVDEVRRLIESRSIGPVAGLAIGYREVTEMLRDGSSLEACKAAVVRDTVAFARRQDHWMRQFPEIRWIDAALDPKSAPSSSTARVVDEFRSALVET